MKKSELKHMPIFEVVKDGKYIGGLANLNNGSMLFMYETPEYTMVKAGVINTADLVRYGKMSIERYENGEPHIYKIEYSSIEFNIEYEPAFLWEYII